MENCGQFLKNLPLACLLIEYKESTYTVSDANMEFGELMGLDRKDLLGANLHHIFSDKLLSKTVKASLVKTLETKKPVVFPYSNYGNLKNCKGEESFWQVTNIPIRTDDTNDIRYIIHIPWDKTLDVLEERKGIELQKELAKKKSESECFIEKNKDGLFALDLKGNFINVNSGLVNLAELPEKDLLKMSFLPFCAAHDRERINRYFEDTLKGDNQQFEADFISGSGRKVILDLSLVPMVVEGKLHGIYGIARDITNRKKSEKLIQKQQDELVGSEKKFRALVQESSDLIGILDEEGNYIFVSESSDSLLGIPPEEFIGKNAFNFIHPEDKEDVLARFFLLQDTKQIKVPPFRFQDSTGTWRWLETTATNLANDPYVKGIVVNSKDVTESKNLFNKISRQNILLNQVAWEHAHLVRSPLVKLKGILDLLEDKDYERWSRKELIVMLRESAEELDDMVLNVVRKNEEIGKKNYV